MKCPIRRYYESRSNSKCDQDFSPMGVRAHFVDHHDTLELEFSIAFMLDELLGKVDKIDREAF